jgi:hypothetical protein
VKELRQLESARLDALQGALWDTAKAGDLSVVVASESSTELGDNLAAGRLTTRRNPNLRKVGAADSGVWEPEVFWDASWRADGPIHRSVVESSTIAADL